MCALCELPPPSQQVIPYPGRDSSARTCYTPRSNSTTTTTIIAASGITIRATKHVMYHIRARGGGAYARAVSDKTKCKCIWYAMHSCVYKYISQKLYMFVLMRLIYHIRVGMYVDNNKWHNKYERARIRINFNVSHYTYKDKYWKCELLNRFIWY